MFFRKQQSGKPSPQTSTALLESEFDFMPDIMILEKIDTPSGTAIDIETSEDIELLPFNETPFPDLAPPVAHPPAEQDNPLEASVDSLDTLALETPESSPEEELIPLETVENSEVADLPTTEDVETPELENSSETLEPENISETDVPIAETLDTETQETDTQDVPISENPETDTPEIDTPDAPVSTTDSSSEEHDQTDSTDPSETETVENEEVVETEVPDELDLILDDLAEDLPEAPQQVISGVFTVGDNPTVIIDWLYDSGSYFKSQMGIFLLDDLDISSPDFINLALQNVTSNSELGYVVLNDATEGAKFASTENGGVYQELKTFNLRARGNYGFVLIPNGSFEEAIASLGTGAVPSLEIEPLFYLGTSNPNSQLSTGLMVDVTGDGNTFALEDLSFKGYNDLDINDLIFQVRGMTGIAVSMDELFDYELVDLAKDWRTSDMGQALIEYVMPFVMDVEQLPFLEIVEAPTTAQPLIGVIDTGFAQNNPYLDYDKITWGNDFIDNDTDPTWQAGESVTTGNEHGTQKC